MIKNIGRAKLESEVPAHLTDVPSVFVKIMLRLGIDYLHRNIIALCKLNSVVTIIVHWRTFAMHLEHINLYKYSENRYRHICMAMHIPFHNFTTDHLHAPLY